MIVAPDGLIYQNLVALDNQPRVNLNASLYGALVPLTGMYLLRAGSSRGFGDYCLHFALTSTAPPAERPCIIPSLDADEGMPEPLSTPDLPENPDVVRANAVRREVEPGLTEADYGHSIVL